MDSVLRHVAEAEISETRDRALRQLLSRCFEGDAGEGFLERRHHLEAPTERWFRERLDGSIVSHVACRTRRVRSGTTSPVDIAGLSELCVNPEERRQGRARDLLAEVARELKTRYDFALVFGYERFYRSSGFRPAPNVFRHWDPVELRWRTEAVRSALVLELGTSRWPTGRIDLQGILF